MRLLPSAGRDWTTKTVTMTLADQAATAGHDGQVTSGKPEPPKSQTFTREFQAKIATGIRCPSREQPGARHTAAEEPPLPFPHRGLERAAGFRQPGLRREKGEAREGRGIGGTRPAASRAPIPQKNRRHGQRRHGTTDAVTPVRRLPAHADFSPTRPSPDDDCLRERPPRSSLLLRATPHLASSDSSRP